MENIRLHMSRSEREVHLALCRRYDTSRSRDPIDSLITLNERDWITPSHGRGILCITYFFSRR